MKATRKISDYTKSNTRQVQSSAPSPNVVRLEINKKLNKNIYLEALGTPELTWF